MENQTLIRVGLFSVCFLMLLLLEWRSPLVRYREVWTINRFTNMLFLLGTVGTSRLLISMSAVSAALFAQSNDFGIFNVFPIHAGSIIYYYVDSFGFPHLFTAHHHARGAVSVALSSNTPC